MAMKKAFTNALGGGWWMVTKDLCIMICLTDLIFSFIGKQLSELIVIEAQQKYLF